MIKKGWLKDERLFRKSFFFPSQQIIFILNSFLFSKDFAGFCRIFCVKHNFCNVLKNSLFYQRDSFFYFHVRCFFLQKDDEIEDANAYVFLLLKML